MASEFVIYLIGINVLTFLIYGIDKWKARRGKWRIPEDTLIWLVISFKTLPYPDYRQNEHPAENQ